MKKTLIFILLFGVASIALSASPKKRQSSCFQPTPNFKRSFLLPQEKQQTPQLKTKLPSKGTAFLYSLLLPGAGEYYAGSKKMARIFFGTEVLLWTTYFSLRAYGDWKKRDYRNFAIAHAGINLRNKDHDYFINIEHFDDIRAYNEEKLRERNVDALYPENDVYSWQWDSRENRLKYEEVRVSSDKAFSNSTLVIGVVVLNHIISGIDALRVARKAHKISNPVHVGFSGLPEGGLQVVLWKQF